MCAQTYFSANFMFVNSRLNETNTYVLLAAHMWEPNQRIDIFM